MDSIKEIMDIENKEEETLKKTHEDAQKIIDDAYAEASQRKEKILSEFEDKKADRIKAEEKEIEKEVQQERKKAETEKQQLVTKAEKKIPEAVDFVIDKLNEVR